VPDDRSDRRNHCDSSRAITRHAEARSALSSLPNFPPPRRRNAATVQRRGDLPMRFAPRQLGASRMAGATLLLNASARPRGSRWRLCGSPYGRNGGKAAVRATTIPKSFSRRRIIPASASRRGAFHDVWPCADLKEVADKETRLQIQSWRTHRLASSPVPASNSNLATQKSAMPKCALVYAVFGIPRRRVFETRQRMWLFRASDELRRRGSNGLRGSARLASDVAV